MSESTTMQQGIPFVRRFVITALAVVSAGCTGRAVLHSDSASPSAAWQAALDSIVERGRTEIGLPGVSVAIMRGDALILAKGYGVADREAGTPATPQTIYPVGSLAKQVTAAAIMTLVEEGRVRLDERVVKYLPEYPAVQTPLPTIRNLLLQNSGLPEWDGLPELEDFDSGDPSRFELSRLVDVIARQPPLYRPGDWWSYSNSNYTLLAAVIERVTGMSYDEYLVRRFFDPLGLRSTGGCTSARAISWGQRAVGYQDATSYALRPVTSVKARAFTGSGGLCSNAVDMAKWMRALVNGKAVTRNSYRQMTTAVPVRAGFTPPYGFGLSMLPVVGQRAVWHMGALSGYMSALVYFPDHDLIISAASNVRRVRLESVVKDLARELLALPTPHVRDLPLDTLEAERLTGNYDDGMFKFRIFRIGAQLFLDVPPSGSQTRLMYQGDREFATARPTDFRLRFEPDTGPAERVVWEWAELRAYGRRVR